MRRPPGARRRRVMPSGGLGAGHRRGPVRCRRASPRRGQAWSSRLRTGPRRRSPPWCRAGMTGRVGSGDDRTREPGLPRHPIESPAEFGAASLPGRPWCIPACVSPFEGGTQLSMAFQTRKMPSAALGRNKVPATSKDRPVERPSLPFGRKSPYVDLQPSFRPASLNASCTGSRCSSHFRKTRIVRQPRGGHAAQRRTHVRHRRPSWLAER